MNDKLKISLGKVQTTLLLPLYGRAQETLKEQPQLKDPTAVQIVEQVDFDFESFAAKMDDLTQIAWIRRSLYCDQVVRDFLARYPNGTVVNVGCGLETNFERLDNSLVRWYDLDLPDTIALRRQFIPESERRSYIESSFTEKGWLDQLEVEGQVLFISAGVLYYFEEAVVKEFFLTLLEKFPGSEIVFDVSSPTGVKIANKKVLEAAGMDKATRLTWGLEDKQEILDWDERIHLINTYFYYKNLKNIGLRNAIMGWVSDKLKIQYILHLKLG